MKKLENIVDSAYHGTGKLTPIYLLEVELSPAQFAIREALYMLFKHFGVILFRAIAKGSWHDITFAVLSKRLARYDGERIDKDTFNSVCDKAARITNASIRRYTRTLFESGQVLKHLDDLGCMYSDCLERKDLLELCQHGPDKMTREERGSVKTWASGTKLCSS